MPKADCIPVSELIAELLQSGIATGRNGQRYDLYPHTMTEDRIRFVTQAAERAQPTRSLETGFCCGLSTLAMLAANPDRDPGSHTAIDIAQGSWVDYAGVVNLERAGLQDCLELIEEDSALALPRLVSEGGSAAYDFCIIDGAHYFENALIDFVFALRLLRPGAMIVIDDLWMPSVRAAMNYAITNLGCEQLPTPAEFQGTKAGERCAMLLTPEQPSDRPWDHFEPFNHQPL